MILGSLEILAESFTLAEKSGIGSQAVLDLVKGMTMASQLGNISKNSLYGCRPYACSRASLCYQTFSCFLIVVCI